MQSRAIVSLALVAGLSFMTVPQSAIAETVVLNANLTGSAVIPQIGGEARGQGSFSYNTETNQLEYSVTYDDLSGPATAVDIHGPASATSNAGLLVKFPIPDSPINGTATLSSEEAAELLAGQLYVDVHTEKHVNGEIRGQIRR